MCISQTPRIGRRRFSSLESRVVFWEEHDEESRDVFWEELSLACEEDTSSMPESVRRKIAPELLQELRRHFSIPGMDLLVPLR
mmetsp:Transcript_9783/g.17302  ORF Transcript_9783/g.17302 Transcript_9783/m.17302 type:complete len:83 (-) Transcript_9783:1062-1310(-)